MSSNAHKNLFCSFLFWLPWLFPYLCLWRWNVALKKKKINLILFLTGLTSELRCLLGELVISTAGNLACQSRKHDTFMYRCICTGLHFWQNGRALWGRYSAFFISLMINYWFIVVRPFRVRVFKSVHLIEYTPAPAILFIKAQKAKEKQQVLRLLAESMKPWVSWLN